MNSQEMIKAMADKGYWTSPGIRLLIVFGEPGNAFAVPTVAAATADKFAGGRLENQVWSRAYELAVPVVRVFAGTIRVPYRAQSSIGPGLSPRLGTETVTVHGADHDASS